MKKTYLSPICEVIFVEVETNLLVSGDTTTTIPSINFGDGPIENGGEL